MIVYGKVDVPEFQVPNVVDATVPVVGTTGEVVPACEVTDVVVEFAPVSVKAPVYGIVLAATVPVNVT